MMLTLFVITWNSAIYSAFLVCVCPSRRVCGYFYKVIKIIFLKKIYAPPPPRDFALSTVKCIDFWAFKLAIVELKEKYNNDI